MRNKTIVLSAQQIESFWMTDDALLVKTKRGKIWFCKKITESAYKQQLMLFQENKPLVFELRIRNEKGGV